MGTNESSRAPAPGWPPSQTPATVPTQWCPERLIGVGRLPLPWRAAVRRRPIRRAPARPLRQSRSRGWSCLLSLQCGSQPRASTWTRALRCGRLLLHPGVRGRSRRSPGSRRHARRLAHPTSHPASQPANERRRAADARVAGVGRGVLRLPVALCGHTSLMVVSPLLGVRSLWTYDFSGAGHAPFSMPA